MDSSLHHFLTGSRPRSRFLPLRADGTQTIWLLPLSLKPHISAAHKSFPKVGKDQFARQKRNQTSKPKSMRNSSPHCFVLRSVTVVVGCLAISAIYSRSESIQKVKSWERENAAALLFWQMRSCLWQIAIGTGSTCQKVTNQKFILASMIAKADFLGCPAPARHCCEMLLHS